MHQQRRAFADSIQAERPVEVAKPGSAADAGALERMVRAAAQDDAAAWDWLVNRLGACVLRAARVQGLTHHDAEDAAQATWARLFRQIHRIHKPESLPAWLMTTARREGLRLRHRGTREQLMGDEPTAEVPVATDFDSALVAAACNDAIARALHGLPERHRALMRALLAEPAPSYAEVSARLGMPIGSIGPIRGLCLTRLRRDEALRELLDPDH